MIAQPDPPKFCILHFPSIHVSGGNIVGAQTQYSQHPTISKVRKPSSLHFSQLDPLEKQHDPLEDSYPIPTQPTLIFIFNTNRLQKIPFHNHLEMIVR